MKKLITSSLIAAALLFAVARPTYAAENFLSRFAHSVGDRWDRFSLSLPGDKSGQTVMKQAMEASEKMKTANMDMAANVDLLANEQRLANVKLTLSGPVEMKDVYDPKSYKQALAVGGEVTMQGTTLRAAADVRFIGNTVYFKINEVPQLPSLNLKDITGKWLKAENTQVDANKETKLTAEQQQKMKDAYIQLMKEAQLGTAKKETKNGVPVFVVNATLPKPAVEKYVQSALEIQKEMAEKTSAPLNQVEAEKSIHDALEKVGDIKAVLWVERSSFFITHTEIPLTFVPDKTKAPVTESASPLAALQNVDKVNVLITVDMKDFNKPVTFDEPKDAEDAQQAFQKLMMGGMQPTQPQTPSELPGLTPKQKLQLEQYKKLQQSGKMTPSTQMPTDFGY
jgi:hypothetical protein